MTAPWKKTPTQDRQKARVPTPIAAPTNARSSPCATANANVAIVARANAAISSAQAMWPLGAL